MADSKKIMKVNLDAFRANPDIIQDYADSIQAILDTEDGSKLVDIAILRAYDKALKGTDLKETFDTFHEMQQVIEAKTTSAEVKDQIEAYQYATINEMNDAMAAAQDATQKVAKSYTDEEVAKDRERLATLEAIDHDAYIAADTALENKLNIALANTLQEAKDYADTNDANTIYDDTDVKASIQANAAAINELENNKANTNAVYTKKQVDDLLKDITGSSSETATAVKIALDTYIETTDTEVYGADKVSSWKQEDGSYVPDYTSDSRIDVIEADIAELNAAIENLPDVTPGTTYTFAPTENPLEFTATPSFGEVQTITLVAPDSDGDNINFETATNDEINSLWENALVLGDITIELRELMLHIDGMSASSTTPSHADIYINNVKVLTVPWNLMVNEIDISSYLTINAQNIIYIVAKRGLLESYSNGIAYSYFLSVAAQWSKSGAEDPDDSIQINLTGNVIPSYYQLSHYRDDIQIETISIPYTFSQQYIICREHGIYVETNDVIQITAVLSTNEHEQYYSEPVALTFTN